MVNVVRFYRTPGLSPSVTAEKQKALQKLSPAEIKSITTEVCFYVETQELLADKEILQIRWVLAPVLSPNNLTDVTKMPLRPDSKSLFFEVGPRLNFSTAFSTNAVSIFSAIGLKKVSRVEISTRYLIRFESSVKPETLQSLEEPILAALHDKMTQCQYVEPLTSFQLDKKPDPWYEVNIMEEGRAALEKVNDHLGLAFDNWDLDYYTELFKVKLARNPTSVECFDLAQSNSEHSRHWFFKGDLVVDGVSHAKSLIDMIIETQETTNQNNVIKFSDNSSAIIGYPVRNLLPTNVTEPSPFQVKSSNKHIIFTAETHNFPTGVAPFSGATTGTGGRIRDVQGVGRGGYVIAGTAGYSFGNLLIPDYPLPWEDENQTYPSNFAPAVEVAVEASNGASDYGNKFGEPVVSGFARSFGMVLPGKSEERREYIKPIMFSGGIGSMDDNMVDKLVPEPEMQVVKLGGPIYRIGVGGGAASSVQVQGDNKANLDFDAVQRGDAEMEQKLNRVIRSCLELGENNPICSIHDQGAGGNGNVLKELVEPKGAVIYTKRFQLGDPTINTLELWGAEYQENDAILCRTEDFALLQQIADRERCPINFVGMVTGDGKVVLTEKPVATNGPVKLGLDEVAAIQKEKNPVNLDLEFVLGKMPRKVFQMEKYKVNLRPLELPTGLKVIDALNRVLRLPSVASKRYLTNKVDRSVTGLVAQQQCVGPLHTPLADVAVIALSYFDTRGSATSIGEQPIKGLLCPAAGARMTVAETMSNLVFAAISDVKDIKCSGNWMWAAKLAGEGAALLEACEAMCKVMRQLGIAVDGGKDSLSMAARVGRDTVKAPGTLVVSNYAPCPDIRKVVTPDLKAPRTGKEGLLVFVDLSGGKSRLGGTALAQVYKQLGDTVADLDDPELLLKAFQATQNLITAGHVLAGHDVSDGGVVTCLLEMAFGGVSGLKADIVHRDSKCPLEVLFSEEVGWVLEVSNSCIDKVLFEFKKAKVPVYPIGVSSGVGPTSKIEISVDGESMVDSLMIDLFQAWEETSLALEKRQASTVCVVQEHQSLRKRSGPEYHITFDPNEIKILTEPTVNAPTVAVIREEGSNGDREMVASLQMVGFNVWDVTMEDIVSRKVTLDRFRGIIFPGGFSYADVLGSAKGWAASFVFDHEIKAQLAQFRARDDTFSFGVCNGCQLLALLQWIGVSKEREEEEGGVPAVPDVFLDHNLSERYESRFPTVRIDKSPAIMLKGMEGSVLGVWIAHAEGRFNYRSPQIYTQLDRQNCVPIRYVDDDMKPTEDYPMNPNGSKYGVAGICSADGRHLAMMPHPERCVLPTQWPWIPHNIESDMTTVAPWLKMFQNAYNWCIASKK
ncbi:Phosphoribosylformylglycinamidine synthase [Orchesella cincta]|uniref:Phosphoribosylformylglycinamidine synthase n=1 Tax=Orchesella cincta TaxID=48709 RepID=A0A1D2N9H3_ORCCI|nr:Phosphoribosylformylglycinamidine synthase [Orchesella cincta]